MPDAALVAPGCGCLEIAHRAPRLVIRHVVAQEIGADFRDRAGIADLERGGQERVALPPLDVGLAVMQKLLAKRRQRCGVARGNALTVEGQCVGRCGRTRVVTVAERGQIAERLVGAGMAKLDRPLERRFAASSLPSATKARPSW